MDIKRARNILNLKYNYTSEELKKKRFKLGCCKADFKSFKL